MKGLGSLLVAACVVLVCPSPLAWAQAGARERSLAAAIMAADVEAAKRALAGGPIDFSAQVPAGDVTLPLTRLVVDVAQDRVPGAGPDRGDARVLEIARLMFAAGASPNFSWRESSSRGSSYTEYFLVERAVAGDDLRVLDILIDAGLDVKGAGAGEALVASAARGFARVVRRLIDAGADVNHRQRRGGRTALSEAVHMRHLEVIALLERAGASEWVAPR